MYTFYGAILFKKTFTFKCGSNALLSFIGTDKIGLKWSFTYDYATAKQTKTI